MRSILLIMWTAFQSFILRHNNDNDDNNTLGEWLSGIASFIYTKFTCATLTNTPLWEKNSCLTYQGLNRILR